MKQKTENIHGLILYIPAVAWLY